MDIMNCHVIAEYNLYVFTHQFSFPSCKCRSIISDFYDTQNGKKDSNRDDKSNKKTHKKMNFHQLRIFPIIELFNLFEGGFIKKENGTKYDNRETVNTCCF